MKMNVLNQRNDCKNNKVKGAANYHLRDQKTIVLNWDERPTLARFCSGFSLFLALCRTRSLVTILWFMDSVVKILQKGLNDDTWQQFILIDTKRSLKLHDSDCTFSSQIDRMANVSRIERPKKKKTKTENLLQPLSEHDRLRWRRLCNLCVHKDDPQCDRKRLVPERIYRLHFKYSWVFKAWHDCFLTFVVGSNNVATMIETRAHAFLAVSSIRISIFFRSKLHDKSERFVDGNRCVDSHFVKSHFEDGISNYRWKKLKRRNEIKLFA